MKSANPTGINMEYQFRKNYYVPGIETIFGENNLRINVVLEKDPI